MNKQPFLKELDKNVLETNEGGVLAAMWRQIIIDTKYYTVLRSMLDRYTKNGGTRNRTTIQSYFTASSMTWKTLLFLIFKILRPIKVKMTMTLTYSDGNEQSHSITIIPPKEEDEDDKKEKDKKDE